MEDGSCRLDLLPSPSSLPGCSGGDGSGGCGGACKWVRGACIGRGSFGSVYLAHERYSSRVFAVKSVKLGSLCAGSSAVEALENEIRILRSLSSPYVVSYVGEETTAEAGGEVHSNLLMEFVPGGTVAGLAARCREMGGAVEEPALRSYTRCVARALEYLHAAGVVHGDVKGRNVLAGPTPGGAKLADFGTARRIHGCGRDREDACAGAEASAAANHQRGTPLWMAPEVVRGEPTTPASDVWSLGCTVIEMATGRAPWSECGHQDAGHMLFRIALSDELPEFPAQLSKSGKDFLDKCLRRDPAERWSCERLLRHPFLAEAAEHSPRSALEWANFGFDSEEDEEEKATPVATLNPGCIFASSDINLSDRVRHLASDGEATWEDTDSWEVVRPVHTPTISPCLADGEAREAIPVSDTTTGDEPTSPRFAAPVGTILEEDRKDDIGTSIDGAKTEATGCSPSSRHRPSRSGLSTGSSSRRQERGNGGIRKVRSPPLRRPRGLRSETLSSTAKSAPFPSYDSTHGFGGVNRCGHHVYSATLLAQFFRMMQPSINPLSHALSAQSSASFSAPCCVRPSNPYTMADVPHKTGNIWCSCEITSSSSFYEPNFLYPRIFPSVFNQQQQ